MVWGATAQISRNPVCDQEYLGESYAGVQCVEKVSQQGGHTKKVIRGAIEKSPKAAR